MVEAHDCPMVEAWGMVVGGIPKKKVCHESSLVQELRGLLNPTMYTIGMVVFLPPLSMVMTFGDQEESLS